MTKNCLNTVSEIDVNFDFTEDTPRFWEGFWESEYGHGTAKNIDPDSRSKRLRQYHQLLWSKPLPNGEVMALEDGRSKFYLKWKDFYFGSDSITASFRYGNNLQLIDKVKLTVSNYHVFIEDYLRKAYTIGGEIILPALRNGLNQRRGLNNRIRDRWDLTMECIRRYYDGEESPLSKDLESNSAFFDLFHDFKGFVDFFFLQDCVDENYKVNLWLETPLFETNPIPKTVDEYIEFIQKELDFVKNRNERINQYCQQI